MSGRRQPTGTRSGLELAIYLVLPALLLQTGCTVLAVADAGVSAVATTVKVGAKAAGAVVDAVVPDKDKDRK